MEMRGRQLQPLEFWFGFEQRRPGVNLAHMCLKTSSKTCPPDKSSLTFILTELGTSRTEDNATPCDVNLRVGSILFTAKLYCVIGDMDDVVKLRIEFSVRSRIAASQLEAGGRELSTMSMEVEFMKLVAGTGAIFSLLKEHFVKSQRRAFTSSSTSPYEHYRSLLRAVHSRSLTKELAPDSDPSGSLGTVLQSKIDELVQLLQDCPTIYGTGTVDDEHHTVRCKAQEPFSLAKKTCHTSPLRPSLGRWGGFSLVENETPGVVAAFRKLADGWRLEKAHRAFDT
ncbi:hypothetical protein LA080_007031 [Diaporthe eres]|nr:hypothetical protein LA080_007031 [Diaporthe eres]